MYQLCCLFKIIKLINCFNSSPRIITVVFLSISRYLLITYNIQNIILILNNFLPNTNTIPKYMYSRIFLNFIYLYFLFKI